MTKEDEPVAEGIGERLVQARSRLGMNQKEFAVAMTVPLTTYQRYEYGRSNPKIGALLKLRGFGVSIDWLLSGEGEMLPSMRSPAEPQQVVRMQIDRELMARIMDGLVMLYREENQRLVPLDQGRMAAEIYDSLIGIEGEAERRGGLRVLLEQRRLEMRRPTPDTTSGKRSA